MRQDSLTGRRSRVGPADRSELDGLGSIRRHSGASVRAGDDEPRPARQRRGTPRRLVRRVLNPGPSPEQRLEELLAQRRSELDEHAERCANRSPSSNGARSCSATRVRRSSGCSDSEPPTSRPARRSSRLPREPDRARDAHSPRPRTTSPGGGRSSARSSSSAPRSNGASARSPRARASSRSARRRSRSEAATLRRETTPVELALRPRRALPTRRDRPRSTHARVRVRRRGVEYVVARIGPLPASGRRAALRLPRARTRERPLDVVRRQLVDRRSRLAARRCFRPTSSRRSA